jgi:hypothetical protein
VSRASGKHGPRAPEAEYGRGDDTGITSTTGNISNEPVQRQDVPVAAPLEEFRGMMAHGVPPADVGHYNREMAEHARHPYKPGYEKLPPGIIPVPVYVVEEAGGGGDALRSASPRHITCPASTAAEPARVCGRNAARTAVLLLNEDTATDIRIAVSPGDLVQSAEGGTLGGALIPWPGNSYVRVDTQDELFAQGAAGAGTPRLSIIEIFSRPGVNG